MAELLIIADDFTGALDTGVQFVSRGVATRVFTESAWDISSTPEDVRVVVVNAETRHLPASEAYHAVYKIASEAVRIGVPYIYKKTDSALRGNIGSELAAVMDAAGADRMVFVPAFPQLNRVTKNGVHYIDGTPVAESVFGRDPFEPVRVSGLREIVGAQTDKPVILHTSMEPGGAKGPGIHIYDAASEEDLHRVTKELGVSGLRLSAGCAGFASALAGALEIQGELELKAQLPETLFVVCGSMNPVTIRQLDRAEAQGFPRLRLTRQQKLDSAWMNTAAGEARIRAWIQSANQNGGFILDVNGSPGSVTSGLNRESIPESLLRVTIADNLGRLIKKLLDSGLYAAIMCTGGDTIQALMRAVGSSELTPVCELMTGVVLAELSYNGKTYPIISKSGGFGEPELMNSLAALVTGKESVSCLA